jgi:hypothetical protein
LSQILLRKSTLLGNDSHQGKKPNIRVIFVALSVFHFERSLANEDARKNVIKKFLTFPTSDDERSVLKEEAYKNVPSMYSTFETFHADRSLLKDVAFSKTCDRSVIWLRSQ